MPSVLPIFNMPVPPLLQREWVVSDRNLPPVGGPPNSPVAHHSFSTVSTGQMSTDLRPSRLINTERENRVQSATTPRRVAHSTLPVLAVAEHSAFKERRQPNAVISSGPRVLFRASEIEVLKHVIMLCGASLFVALLLATYGLDLSPGFF